MLQKNLVKMQVNKIENDKKNPLCTNVLTYCAIILKSVKINKKPTSDLYNNHQKTAYLIKT